MVVQPKRDGSEKSGKAEPAAPVATVETDRRRRRGQQRREDILAAAAALFHERGYHATKIDEIGEAAGVTGPAVYRHFRSKEEILDTLVVEYGTRILEHSASIAADTNSPDEALKELVEYQVSTVIEFRSTAAVAVFERRTLPPATRAAVDRMDRINTAEWVHVLCQLRPELTDDAARVMVRAALFFSLSICNDNSGLSDDALRTLLTDSIMRTLTTSH